MLSDSQRNAQLSLLQKWQPVRGPFSRWPRFSDGLLAFVSFLLTLAIWYSEYGNDNVLGVGATLMFIVGNASLYWRRRYPEHVHAIVLVLSTLAMLSGQLYGPIFAFAVSLYNVGRYFPDDRRSAVGLALAYLVLLVGELTSGGLSGDELPELIFPFLLWYVGRRLRARGEYLRVLRERADQLEREQLVEAERAVGAERTRIARELHDIVAHQVSLMTVQAGAAKTVAASDPAAASKAMEAVEGAGRQALGELRHLLGVLRPDEGKPAFKPQPGRADLPRLIDDLQRAGLQVSLEQGDQHRPLPARIELAIYRIVQEALTNVLKHAGQNAQAMVRVFVDEHAVTLSIEDNGSGSSRLPGSKHGITGMRERAQSLGGTLQAGAAAHGGFLVTARLPLSEGKG